MSGFSAEWFGSCGLWNSHTLLNCTVSCLPCLALHAQVVGAILAVNKKDSESEHDIFFEDCFTEVRCVHARLCVRYQKAAKHVMATQDNHTHIYTHARTHTHTYAQAHTHIRSYLHVHAHAHKITHM